MDFSNAQNSVQYYGIYVPPSSSVDEFYGEALHVYKDRTEALKVVKKLKKARFKVFKTQKEAEEFAVNGSEQINNSIDQESCVVAAEKSSPFRGPKSQDLVLLRKSIEAGNLEVVKTTVWENPRYFVSSGDTPSILQEGSRYNALHIATKATNAKMCELILGIVSSAEFVKLLYDQDDIVACQDRANILVDLYLNTPDKGLNETPLHFAVKFGSVACVEILTSYPQCDKQARNKFNQLPKDMICQRCDNNNSKLKNDIAALLEDRFYVPVLRSEDNSIQPRIGTPFSTTSPPKIKADPLSPRIEIRAFAGPMKKQEAMTFHKKWKTPPRVQRTVMSPGSPAHSPNTSASFRLLDTEKGLERVGRELAQEHQVGWNEYWPFLGTFANLASEEGLKLLENFLSKKFHENVSKICSSNNNSICSTEDIKKTGIDNSTNFSPITDLCEAFSACNLSDKQKSVGELNSFNTNNNLNEEHLLHNPNLNPYLCLEKSIQVFATRIHNSLTNIDIECLRTEIKHLQALIASYMTDSRFSSVDFHVVHSRIASNINHMLNDKRADRESPDEILFRIIVELKSKSIDSLLNSHIGEHALCIVQKIADLSDLNVSKENTYSEENCVQKWGEAVPCGCVWEEQHFKRNTRKTASLSRVSSKKCVLGTSTGFMESVTRKLFTEPSSDVGRSQVDTVCERQGAACPISGGDAEDEEMFFTPPSSPIFDENSDSEDEMMDASCEGGLDFFLEGDIPTRIDTAVFHAIQNVKITPAEYPCLYQWRHAVQLHREEDRERWPSPAVVHYESSNPLTSTPRRDRSVQNCSTPPFTPPHPWSRITGVHSPRGTKMAASRLSFTD